MRVVVAMSGGVDSSVAAALMRAAGHEVIGVALQLWDYSCVDTNKFGTCCSPDDLYDARRVSELLGIPFYVVNAERTFREHVVDDFVSSYSRGETPNPCVRCNDQVKFARLLNVTRGFGADRLVTGHYARKEALESGIHVLLRARDSAKDQTYYLCRLTQERLARVEFPLGYMTKESVREYAAERGLPTASKHDSQELCFVPDNRYAEFIEGQGKKLLPGDIVNVSGDVIGTHRGLHHYTVGQRKGLRISSTRPLYVIEVDRERNRLVVGADEMLFRRGLVARDVQWISGAPGEEGGITARVRYRARDVPVSLTELGVGGRYKVILGEAQRAVTPGQAVVFYLGEQVLGGGWIERALREDET